MRKVFKLSDIRSKSGFTKFWKYHQNDFVGYIRKHNLNKNDPEANKEILQNTATNILQFMERNTQREIKDVYIYCLSISQNAIKDYYKKNKKHKHEWLKRESLNHIFSEDELRTIRFNIDFQKILRKHLNNKQYYFFIVDNKLLNRKIFIEQLKPLEGKKIKGTDPREYIQLKDTLPSIYEDETFYSNLCLEDIFKNMNKNNISTIRNRAMKAIQIILEEIRQKLREK